MFCSLNQPSRTFYRNSSKCLSAKSSIFKRSSFKSLTFKVSSRLLQSEIQRASCTDTYTDTHTDTQVRYSEASHLEYVECSGVKIVRRSFGHHWFLVKNVHKKIYFIV